jgi:hypothetical protein
VTCEFGTQGRVPMLASSLDRNEIAIVSPKSITSGQMSARATFSGLMVVNMQSARVQNRSPRLHSDPIPEKQAKGSQVTGVARPSFALLKPYLGYSVPAERSRFQWKYEFDE